MQFLGILCNLFFSFRKYFIENWKDEVEFTFHINEKANIEISVFDLSGKNLYKKKHFGNRWDVKIRNIWKYFDAVLTGLILKPKKSRICEA